ncbi:MAG TPA: hypothetical protein VNW92_02285, partial [Polyangiaceae bacterium]|nr:hypothetical protein [Polyangiaceae bacterium]
MRIRLIAPVVLGLLAAAACSGGNTSQVSGGGAASGNGSAASGNGTSSGGSLIVGSGGSSASGNGTGNGGSGTLGPDGGCADTKANGEPIPVDLFFMVDTTGSMNCPVPDDPKAPPCEVDPGGPYSKTTRWTVESAALKAFVADPANTGLGMGIRFFPGNKNLCDAATYATPAVEIADLPGAAMALDTAIGAVTPGGQTPTEASIGGALQHAAAWAKAHPTHRVAVVYSTDGYPMGCAGDSIAAAAALAKAA